MYPTYGSYSPISPSYTSVKRDMNEWCWRWQPWRQQRRSRHYPNLNSQDSKNLRAWFLLRWPRQVEGMIVSSSSQYPLPTRLIKVQSKSSLVCISILQREGLKLHKTSNNTVSWASTRWVDGTYARFFCLWQAERAIHPGFWWYWR